MSWRSKRKYLRADAAKKNAASEDKTIMTMLYESLGQEAAPVVYSPRINAGEEKKNSEMVQMVQKEKVQEKISKMKQKAAEEKRGSEVEQSEMIQEPEEEPQEISGTNHGTEKELQEISGMKQEPNGKDQDNKKMKPEEEKMSSSEHIAGSPVDTSLESLEPSDVFHYFREIAAIPHGSFHTKQISDYLENFAKEKGFACVRDEMGNLIISRPGAPGFEDAAPIALQGHIDMVCEKEASRAIDMAKDPLVLCTDGEWLWADGTTLGGDDGIGVAMMLAVLADDSIQGPPLECIFTVDEEVGLLGAEAIDLSGLKSRRMINLDSESEGILTAGCAGGAEEICSLPGRRREKRGQVMQITVSGLFGGHSGEAASLARGNADLLLARLLYRLSAAGKYCIVSMNGGNRDNAVPREAKAEILFTGKVKRKKIRAAVETFRDEVRAEYGVLDPGIRIEAQWTGKDREEGEEELRIAFTKKDSFRMVRFLMALPNGVIEYSRDYPDVPQTSLSLGIVKTMADGIRTHSLVRSSIDSQKKFIMDRIDCIAAAFGASVETNGAYPGWQYLRDSSFRNLAADVYRDVTGRDMKICVIHGGLECGLLAAKVPGLDCISIGPDMEGVHTPAERLNIPSTARTYAYLRALLEACV